MTATASDRTVQRVAGGRDSPAVPLATTATVVLGVLSLYAALLLLSLLTSPVLVPSQLLEQGTGHAVRVGDYMNLVWLTSSLATLGGALGAGLESDEAVRAAAYTYRQDGG